jgi:hypothetical protein
MEWMQCWMMGKGFGIRESRVGPVPLTHASNSSDGANYTAQLGGLCSRMLMGPHSLCHASLQVGVR